MGGWEEVRSVLISSSPQTLAADRIRIDSANEGDIYPLVIGRRVDVTREHGLDNTLLSHRETYLLECWGEDRDEAATLEAEVIDALYAAGMPPDDNGPDGVDPVVDVRAGVVYVTVWLDIPFID